ncbi:hypothetical protein [Erwinia psidii]|nr:hypothetical protein [Erwinia psidii]
MFLRRLMVTFDDIRQSSTDQYGYGVPVPLCRGWFSASGQALPAAFQIMRCSCDKLNR